jgi:hypothetical protein
MMPNPDIEARVLLGLGFTMVRMESKRQRTRRALSRLLCNQLSVNYSRDLMRTGRVCRLLIRDA